MDTETNPAPAKAPAIAITMCACNSSQLQEHGYDATTRTLAIRFKGSGKLYHYADVPQETYDALVKAESFGRFFNTNLRGKFAYQAINESPAEDVQ